MASFDFVTDEDLRNSLESDFKELALCHAARAWKAVHVLAGSIIEATLIDYLVSSGKIDAAAANNKDLGQLIELCRTECVLSRKAIELSTIVRSYRNLIHPGRVLRLSEQPYENGATIAKSVIEIVVDEVCSKKRETYGYTAEQVVHKLQQDSSSLSITEHLLRETRPTEIRRLLLVILPSAYVRSCGDPDQDPTVAARLQHLFRAGIKVASKELLALVGSRYVNVLKEEPEGVVQCYELGLFRGSDLLFIEDRDKPLVIAHFLGTMKRGLSGSVLEAARGITLSLHGETLNELIRILAAAILRDKPTSMEKHLAGRVLYQETWDNVAGSERVPEELQAAISAVKAEHKWHEQMQKVLEGMEGIVEVPF
jgi:hypothetical protein